MRDDLFKYVWKKAIDFYHEEDGIIILHEDAPEEVKESYKEYHKYMNRMNAFMERSDVSWDRVLKKKNKT